MTVRENFLELFRNCKKKTILKRLFLSVLISLHLCTTPVSLKQTFFQTISVSKNLFSNVLANFKAASASRLQFLNFSVRNVKKSTFIRFFRGKTKYFLKSILSSKKAFE